MDENAQREREFNKSIAGTMTAFALGACLADQATKQSYVKYAQDVFALGAVELKSSTSLIGIDATMDVGFNVPAATLLPMEPLVVKSATIIMDMTVTNSIASSTSVKSDTEAEGGAKIGWGILSAHLNVKSSVGVAKENKRSSDYSATTHAELVMAQGPTPEGLAKIIDCLCGVTLKAAEINQVLIERQADQIFGHIDGGTTPTPSVTQAAS